MTYPGIFSVCKCEFRRCMKVVFPDPAMPMQIMEMGVLPFVEGAVVVGVDEDPVVDSVAIVGC